MGTQQILLIVLSVIIVGAAIAVGIDMFNRQDYSSNRSAAAADVQLFLTQVLQYYKMPESLGGLGGKINNSEDADSIAEDADAIAAYIGWGDDNPMKNDNATYLVVLPAYTSGDDQIVDIKAICRSTLNDKSPVVHGRITFPEGKISSRVGENPRVEGAITKEDFDAFDLWESK